MKFTLIDVMENTPVVLYLLVMAIFCGFGTNMFLMAINPSYSESIVELIGTVLSIKTGEGSNIGFIISNIVAIAFTLLIALLILNYIVSKKIRGKGRLSRFRKKDNKLLTKFLLYVVPLGLPTINGIVIGFTYSFIIASHGWSSWYYLFAPHLVFEMFALIFGAALAYSYAKILGPLINKKNFKKVFVEILLSKTTLLVLLFIAILLTASGLMENLLIKMI